MGEIVRINIRSHNRPGGKHWTPTGFVATDQDGNASVTPEQLAHLKSSKGLQITTREIPSGSVTTRDSGKK